MLDAIKNSPVDVGFLNALVEDPSDLQLMMPTAELPFNKSQWLAKLAPDKANHSYKVSCDGVVVGHFAFLRVNHELSEATLGLVYLGRKMRKTGMSYELISLAETVAREQLNIKTILLNVRTFNAPAYHLYLKAGYREYERQDDIVRMRRSLQ